MKNDSCRSVLRLCMFLSRRKEQMGFVQEDRIEYRVNDITSESLLLPSNSLDGSPLHITLDIARYFELTVGWKIAIDFQKSLLHSFWSGTCADINEFPHEFVQHLTLLPFFNLLPWRTLVEVKVLEIEGHLWQVILNLPFCPYIGSTAIRSSSAFELAIELTLLFCCHTP